MSEDVKYRRMMFYYDELSRHNIDIEQVLQFMEYIFDVKRTWIMRVVKGHVPFDRDAKLEHLDLDAKMIDAFVLKLFNKAKKERSSTLSLFPD